MERGPRKATEDTSDVGGAEKAGLSHALLFNQSGHYLRWHAERDIKQRPSTIITIIYKLANWSLQGPQGRALQTEAFVPCSFRLADEREL